MISVVEVLSMVAVITGPTASGKSALAMDVAERLGGTIINADASQLYADLAIVSARPSQADTARVPHLLYGVVDGADPASAARWAEMAKAAIADVLAQGRLPIMVGGTGMYLSTLIHGIAPVPAIEAKVRDAVRSMTTDDAWAALGRADPAMAVRLAPRDRQRILRALEVRLATGRSLLDWQATRTGGIEGAYVVRAAVVDVPRAVLNARAEARLQAMVADGALAEIAALMARGLAPDLPVMRALGVREFGTVLAGESSLDDATAAAATATRQYQKRQMTWARNQAAEWRRVDAGAADALAAAWRLSTR